MAKYKQMTREEVIEHIKNNYVWKGRLSHVAHEEWLLSDRYAITVFDKGDFQEIDGKTIFDMKVNMADSTLKRGLSPKPTGPILFFGEPAADE